jgi:hypothetical protein
VQSILGCVHHLYLQLKISIATSQWMVSARNIVAGSYSENNATVQIYNLTISKLLINNQPIL